MIHEQGTAPLMCGASLCAVCPSTGPAVTGSSVNMEAAFSQLTLDVIGKAVFNYNFNSLTQDSPIIQVGEVHVVTCSMLQPQQLTSVQS